LDDPKSCLAPKAIDMVVTTVVIIITTVIKSHKVNSVGSEPSCSQFVRRRTGSFAGILSGKLLKMINLYWPIEIQGTGIKKWYAAGVGWVGFGQNSGTLQPNHTQPENMLRW